VDHRKKESSLEEGEIRDQPNPGDRDSDVRVIKPSLLDALKSDSKASVTKTISSTLS
jgi:hypothetical protein